MIPQRLALYEDENDALRELVRELGGNKVVGKLLRPELDALAGGGWLKDCLNPERRERLDPQQAFLLLRMGREKGIHGPCEFILAGIGYAVQAVSPADEAADLQRQYVESVRLQRLIADRLEKLAPAMRAVA